MMTQIRANGLTEYIKWLIRRPQMYSLQASNIQLRPYQAAAVEAVISSVYHTRGYHFVWIFPRQSGKDESLAVLVSYLLAYYSDKTGELVFFNPTFKPQTETSMRRLETRLKANVFTRGLWKRKSGYIYQVGDAFCTYMSADESSHIVGATASVLLMINEAQDISPFKYDKDIDPMVASTNATKLFSGTRWTSDTLLEREYQRAMEEEKADGIQRVFFFTADDVRQYVPAYGQHVDGAIARLGRQHPLVKTQYFCETIDAQAGMFPPGRQVLMQGSHSNLQFPVPGRTYVFLIDVAGQDESRSTGEEILQNPGRDATALKIVEIDQATVSTLGKPTYKVVFRQLWTGEKHVVLFGKLRALAASWKPLRLVIDATGVGEGLWSLLDNALGADVVIPIKFTPQIKSNLGYGFIGIVDSGRYQEYHPFDDTFRLQLEKCRSEIVPGPAKLMRWGVPDGTRDSVSGELVHDDDLMTGALCTILDTLEWYTRLPTVIIPGKDPLPEMDRNF
ncbi:MAG: hypothetical protein ABSF99_07390 [Anaerolineales bacterium]|jgi:hypothetical protein